MKCFNCSRLIGVNEAVGFDGLIYCRNCYDQSIDRQGHYVDYETALKVG